MGYTTDFSGSFEITPKPTKEFTEYLNRFSATRRMSRDVEKIKQCYPNWKDLCFNHKLGNEGEYFAPESDSFGQENDNSVLDYNDPPSTQPGLWCQWIIDDNQVKWDGGEKFYNYIDWLKYLIGNFFAPQGYTLNGEVNWYGESSDDFGIIQVEDNIISVAYGEMSYSSFQRI